MKKIIIDEAIPHLTSWLGDEFCFEVFPADAITADTLVNADGLIVRTLTKVDAQLLSSSANLVFVASATSGMDHIDHDLLNKKGIYFAHAPGCNAEAVRDYVMACFHALGSPDQNKRIGIIGLGHVGSLVRKAFDALGYETICYDPPKAEQDLKAQDSFDSNAPGSRTFSSAALQDLHSLDLLCIHPSLTMGDRYSSKGVVDDRLLSQQNDGTVLIQASRGLVCDEQALIDHAERLTLCVDVWQNEPSINQKLFDKVAVATPHIAGYSTLAKWQASKMVVEALCRRFDLDLPHFGRPDLSECHQLNVMAVDNAWRGGDQSPEESFHALRKIEKSRL